MIACHVVNLQDRLAQRREHLAEIQTRVREDSHVLREARQHGTTCVEKGAGSQGHRQKEKAKEKFGVADTGKGSSGKHTSKGVNGGRY